MSSTLLNGYTALPASGTGDPVLVLHPWWGLNDTIKAFCNRLAEAGFVAFAPDLHHGQIATTIPDAEALAGVIFNNLDSARAEVGAAIAFLAEHADPDGRGLAPIPMAAVWRWSGSPWGHSSHWMPPFDCLSRCVLWWLFTALAPAKRLIL